MQQNTIILDWVDEVYFKTSKITIEQQLELRNAFACKAKDFFFDPRYRNGSWNGDIHFYNMRTNLFPIGLLSYFINFCKKFNYSYFFNFDINDFKNEVSDEEIEKLYKSMFVDSFKLREYQDYAIKKAIRLKRGIIEHATGSGKSSLIYFLTRFVLALNKKILIVVPNINLVTQLFDNFKEFGWNDAKSHIGLIYGKSYDKDFDKPVIISTWQSLYKKNNNFFKQFKMVIFDECHGCKAISLKTIMEKCVDAEYRLGFTGSLQDKKDKNELANYLTIVGYLGPVIAKETTQNLINNGFLSDLVIASILIKYPPALIELTKYANYDYQEEVDIIQKYKNRNKVLNYILNNINKQHNILILCHEIENHLKIVEQYIRENFKDWKLHIIYGDTDVEVRDQIKKELTVNGGNILLSSYGTTSTGVNIPKLHHVVFFSSYKSKIKIFQSLGRGLRKHESKDKLIVWDIVDDLSYKSKNDRGREVFYKNYVYGQWLKRLKYYKESNFKCLIKNIDLEKNNK